jgi:enoyl-CoA hydratase/carnithine racemase
MEAVETVWIDNPPLNLLTDGVAEALDAALRRGADRARVLVLRGRGERGFSAGADVTGFEPGAGAPARIQPLADLIESLPVPVVAALHGHCLGGGLELALACDVRVADVGASLGFPEIRLGLLPGGGGTQRAPRLIGRGRATWLILSGEPVSAARAFELGLVECGVDDLDAGVEQVAGLLAAQSPGALAAAKRLLQATRDERSDALELEAFEARLNSEDGHEGLAAFRERRPPNWSGR